MDLETKLKSLDLTEPNCNLILDSQQHNNSVVCNDKCQHEICDGKEEEAIKLNGTQEHKTEVIKLFRELPDKSKEPIEITYKAYESEIELPNIMKLIQKDLSEPYSIYTYRYFIHNWGHLCYLALHENKCVGCIVCKLDIHRSQIRRGYIAMLAVDSDYRKLKIGTTLVQKAIRVI
jgi:hypothetical protein